MKEKVQIGDTVRVTDPDGEVWVGEVLCPSVLWEGWWVVRRKDRKYKSHAHVVHINDME